MNTRVVIMLIGTTICYAVEPETTTTTQVKEQVQRIEIPSHIRGLRIINNNTLRWDDGAKPVSLPPYKQEQYPTRSVYQSPVSGGKPVSSWQRALIGGVCVGTAYTLLRAYFYLLAKELEKESHWWNWKSDVALSVLSQLPEKQVAHELSMRIQERYKQQGVHDVAFIMPLVNFIQDTNYEQGYLEHLITVYNKVHVWNVQLFFAADEQVLDIARAKLARLTYIRRLYMKWLSSYAADIPTVS